MNITNIEVVYLPANTTAIIQPMKVGIVRCRKKANYRKHLIKKLVLRLECYQDVNIENVAKSFRALDLPISL